MSKNKNKGRTEQQGGQESQIDFLRRDTRRIFRELNEMNVKMGRPKVRLVPDPDSPSSCRSDPVIV